MNYLIGLGHRRIGFIGGRTDAASAISRFNGYLDALSKAGIPVDDSLIVHGDFTTETGYKCARKVLELTPPPTAIFAANDQTAVGVYQAAEELKLKIPEDVSVVGFDNIPEAKYIGLTTVDQSIPEMGYVAVQMLTKLVNKESLDAQVYEMSTKLVVRNSCREVRPLKRRARNR